MSVLQELQAALRGSTLVAPAVWEGLPGAAFGGFTAAAALLAGYEASEYDRPASLTGGYFRPLPIHVPVQVAVEVLHRGRRFDGVLVRLLHEGRTLAAFQAHYAARATGAYHSTHVEAPDPLTGFVPNWQILDQFGTRVPAFMRHTGYLGTADDRAVLDGSTIWNHFQHWPATSDPLDRALTAVMVVDSFVAPATWAAHGDRGREPGVDVPTLPTLDIGVWFHDTTGSGGLDSRTAVIDTGGGFATGRTEVWDHGRLVATGVSQVVQVMPR